MFDIGRRLLDRIRRWQNGLEDRRGFTYPSLGPVGITEEGHCGQTHVRKHS